MNIINRGSVQMVALNKHKAYNIKNNALIIGQTFIGMLLRQIRELFLVICIVLHCISMENLS